MPRKSMYIGIDIGKDGGIAGLVEYGEPILYPMPVVGKKGQGPREYNLNGISSIISEFNSDYEVRGAVIEDATFQPKWSKKTWGDQYGCLYVFMTLFAERAIPYRVVRASIWQKKVFESMSAKQDTKTKAELFCFRRFPKAEFILGQCKKAHSGILDAACIAEYARLTYGL